MISGYSEEQLTFLGESRPVYRGGCGPGIVLMHEIPGIHPRVVRLADQIRDAGFSVWLPSLVGVPGKAFSRRYAARSFGRACVMKEFSLLAKSMDSPVVSWLRELVTHVSLTTGHPGVGAIGMCLTGGFALGMSTNNRLVAPVLCNPSLPLAVTRTRRSDLGVSGRTLQLVRQRVREGGLEILGVRFSNDIACPGQRFNRMQAEFGEAFRSIVIDSSPGNAHGIDRWSHSVLGEHLVDIEGHPTRLAEEKVLHFLRDRLLPSCEPSMATDQSRSYGTCADENEGRCN